MRARIPKEALRGDARHRAAEVVARVEADGAFASAALTETLQRPPVLDARDRALATELAYGTLRTLPLLDDALARLSRDGAASIARLDPWARAVLRVAAYQVLALERIPPSAAVDAAVGALRKGRSAGLAGFANAVLRKLVAQRPASLPATQRVDLAVTSLPPTVRRRVAALLGDDAVDSVFRAAFGAADEVTVRVNPRRTTPEALRERLLRERDGATVRPGRSPLALRVRDAGDLTFTKAWKEGHFDIQEDGAQCAALEAGVQPGMRVLDLCAGRGGKTAFFASQLAGSGHLDAVDVHPAKLETLRTALARQGLDEGLTVRTFAVDLAVGDGPLASAAPAEGYDVVMVDAPCSGLGTLARHPDLLLRLRSDADWTSLVAQQTAIVARAQRWVRPGGVLVYAVCTLTRDEADAPLAALPEGWTDTSTCTVLRPDEHGTDGFVVRRFRRANAPGR